MIPVPETFDTERIMLTGRWTLGKAVRTSKGWRYTGEVASATTLEALTAANMLLTGNAELGLAKPWREARTFLTYDEEGNLVLEGCDE